MNNLDIKPENFIITDGGQLRVIDLGLSFRLPQNQSSILRPFAGTPEYMPPEVCQIQNGHYSRQGRASDIWALGLFISFFINKMIMWISFQVFFSLK